MQLSAVAARRLAAAAAAALQNTTTTTNKGTVVTTDNITQTVPSSVAIADDDHHDDESDASTVHSITSSSPHSSVNLSLASLPLSPPPTSSRGTKRKRTHDENIASPTTASGVTFPLAPRRVHDDRLPSLSPTTCSLWTPRHGQNFILAQDEHDCTVLTIGLCVDETLVLRGVYSVQCLRGIADINNARLTPSSAKQLIFAPSTHTLPLIIAVSTSDEPHDTYDELPGYDVVLRLIDAPNTGIEGIERICKAAGMPVPPSGMWAGPQSTQPLHGGTFQVITEPISDVSVLTIPDAWRAALDAVHDSNVSHSTSKPASITKRTFKRLGSQHPTLTPSSPARRLYLIQGSKSVGKSTFSRLLLNTLLRTHENIAWLDCDLGQGELSPPGILALHVLREPLLDPSFVNLGRRREAVKAHYSGCTTPRNDPQRYLAAIEDLLTAYDALVDDTPLIVNTHGWTKGLGADLLAQIQRMAMERGIARVFELRASSTYGNPNDEPLSARYDAQVSGLVSDNGDFHAGILVSLPAYAAPQATSARMTSSDLRTLALASYFHSRSSHSSTSPSWDFDTSLPSVRPKAVPWSTFRSVRVLSSEHIPYELLLHALDVSVVGLCETTYPSKETTKALPYYPHTTSSNDDISSMNCLGLGIIRSIDTSNSQFYILTPLPSSMCTRVNMLMKGDIELPTVLMLDNDEAQGIAGMEWQNVPYLLQPGSQSGGIGAAKRRVRRNVMRRSQVVR